MASDDDKPQKISIGFDGGQVLSARVKPGALSQLREALDRGVGWHDLGTEEGTVALKLSGIVYVIVAHEEQRVGFGI